MVWGVCFEKMIPNRSVQRLTKNILVVLWYFRRYSGQRKHFCDFTCTYFIYLFNSNQCLLDFIANNWRLRLSNFMKFWINYFNNVDDFSFGLCLFSQITFSCANKRWNCEVQKNISFNHTVYMNLTRTFTSLC